MGFVPSPTALHRFGNNVVIITTTMYLAMTAKAITCAHALWTGCRFSAMVKYHHMMVTSNFSVIMIYGVQYVGMYASGSFERSNQIWN